MKENKTKKQKSLSVRILWLLLTTPLIGAENMISALLQQRIWDALPMDLSMALRWGMIFIFYLGLTGIIGGLNTIHQVFFAKEAAYRLKKQVYKSYVHNKKFLYERKSLGSTINHDIPMLDDEFYYAAIHGLICLVEVLLAFTVTFSVNIYYGLFCFIVMLMPILSSIRQVDKIGKTKEEILQKKEGYTKFLSEVKKGKETIRHYSLLEVIFGQHKEWISKIAVLGSKKRTQMAANFISGQNMNRLAGEITSLGGFYLVSQGKLTLGWVMAFLQLSSSMTYCLVDAIQTGIAVFSCRKIRKNLSEQYELSNQSILLPQKKMENFALETKEYSQKTESKMGCHCYIQNCKLGERTILEGIDFTIAPGEKLLITGKNGSGKTTLLKILLGLNENYKGFVEWSNEKETLEKETMLYQIAYIPQNPFIFDGTVKENILLDLKEEEEAYQKIKQKVCLFVEDDKKVSYLQQKLSGGEKQKVELARAFYSGRNVLIFDEPYSALDQDSFIETEEYLFTDPTKTVIVVSHVERKETRKLYTSHLIFEDGKVQKIEH